MTDVELIAREELDRGWVPVYITACDSLSREGVASQLRGHRIEVVDEKSLGPDVVAVLVVDDVDERAADEMRRLRRLGVERMVVVAGRIDDAGLLAAAEGGAGCVLRRTEATPKTLRATIQAAALGEGALPPDLVGRLIGQVGRLQRQVLTPRGITFSGMTERELEVLRLLSEGLDTAAVGRRMCLSERSVKNVVHALTTRLNLRNRTHAVAYAMRQGLI